MTDSRTPTGPAGSRTSTASRLKRTAKGLKRTGRGKPSKPRKRKCKAASCREWFVPRNTLQTACSGSCAIEVAREAEAKRARREKLEGRKRLRTLSDWMKLAQTAVNTYVRERDRDKPCISCRRFNDTKRNAGHYKSVGAHPELRFETLNINVQCEHCNTYLSGNIRGYRDGIIERYGLATLEWLDGPHPPKKYTIDDLRAIRDEYRAKVRELRRAA